MKRPSRELIALWYAKLRATGFRDVEGGRDLNELHASTFRGGDGSHGAAVHSWPDGFEPQQRLADHPTAVYFRGLEHAARELTGERRVMLLAASDGNIAAAARSIGRNRFKGHRRVQRFAVSIGLRREAHGS